MWQLVYSADDLVPEADSDGDGFSNAQESLWGTNPRDPASQPRFRLERGVSDLRFHWSPTPGKQYDVWVADELSVPRWIASVSNALPGTPLANLGLGSGFFRLEVRDVDSDGDGLNDWEELALGFDPASDRTGRASVLDRPRVEAALSATNRIAVSS